MMNWSEIDNKIVTVTANDFTTLLSDLAQHFDANEGFSVATLNLDHVVKFRNDSAFRKAYAEHSHVTADGNPIVWLSRLAGQSDVSLVPGSELIEPLLKLAAEKKVPVAFFGSSDATMEAVIRKTKQKFPNLEVALAHSPPMGFDPDGQQAAHAIEMLHQSGARVVFLALGAPKQEKFAARAQKDLKHVGFLSIGAGLDFIAGSCVSAFTSDGI